MRKLIPVVVMAMCLGGCSKSPAPETATPAAAPATSSPAGPTGAKPNDAVQQKLVDLAGNGATDCGRLNSQAEDQLKAASSCATQAAESKHAFYVAYDMPGMTVGVAGNADGKLFTAQAEGTTGLASGACPAQLRVAPSGRVTCFAPGDMGSMGGGHGRMGTPPPGMTSPHDNKPH